MAAAPKKEPPVVPPVKKQVTLPIMTMILGCCILMLSVGIFFVVTKKKGADKSVKPDPTLVQKDNSQPVQKNDGVTRVELDSKLAEINQKLDGIVSRVDKHQQRIWLLAVANNENAALRRKLDAQYHGLSDAGYIVFDENWKINRVPDTMEMDDKQKQLLEKFVK